MGRQHYTTAGAKTPIVPIVVVAVSGGGIVRIVVERTATQHLPGSLTDLSQPSYCTTF